MYQSDDDAVSQPTPQVWLAGFLKRRGLVRPDGRSLYQYHPTIDEYFSLRSCLQADSDRRKRLGCLIPNAASIVLYCALWYAYEYEDGSVKWEPPLASIGAEDVDDDPVLRTRLVQMAAHYWGHDGAFTYEGFYYIGYVFSQAGVPVKALLKQSGWVGRMIFSIFRWQARNGFPDEVLINAYLMGQLSNPDFKGIPSGILKERAVEIISKAVVTLRLTLKEMSSAQGTNTLSSSQFQSFDLEFPGCRLTDEMFGKFLREFSSNLKRAEKGEDNGRVVEVERLLVNREGQWGLFGRVEFKKRTMPKEQFFSVFGFPLSALSSFTRGTLLLGDRPVAMVAQAGVNMIAMRMHRGNSVKFSGPEALRSVVATYRPATSSGSLMKAQIPLRGLGPVDVKEPLVFVRQSVDLSRWSFKGNGSCSIAGSEAMVWIHADARVSAGEGGFEEVSGDFMGGRLLRVFESLEIHVEQDVYAIRLRQVKVSDEIYELRGNLWGYTADGLPVYRGMPKVVRHQPGAWLEQEVRSVRWSNDVGREQYGAVGSVGKFVCKVTDDAGELKRRIRVVLLPSIADDSSCLARSAMPGRIEFSDWDIQSCKTSDEDVSIEYFDRDCVVTCNPRRSINDSLSLTLEVLGRHRVSPILLTLDYPQRFVGFISRTTRNRYEHDHELTLDEIKDLQAVVKVAAAKGGRFRFGLRIYPKALEVNEHLGRKNYESFVPIHVDAETGVGILNFEEFSPVIYRTMRACAGEAEERYVSIELDEENATNRCRVRVVHADTRFLITETNDVMVSDDCTRPICVEARSLWSPFERVTLGLVGRRLPLPLPSVLLNSSEPWWIYELGDAKLRTPPAIFVPNGFRTSMDAPIVQQIPRLWKTDFSDVSPVFRQMEGAVQDVLSKPSSCLETWRFLRDQLMVLGGRGFAQLPYWRALSRNVPLAFAFASVLTLTTPRPSGVRSLLSTVARLHSWRWELISQSSLNLALRKIDTCLKKMGLEDGGFSPVSDLLDDESVSMIPAVRHKMLVGLASEGLLHLTSEHVNELICGLDAPLAKGMRNVSLDHLRSAWHEMIDRHQNGIADGGDVFFQETRLMTVVEELSRQYVTSLGEMGKVEAKMLRLIEREFLRVDRVQGSARLRGFERVKYWKLPVILPIIMAFCWEMTSQKAEGLEKQTRLAQKGIFYFTESLLSRDPELTADAFGFAALLMAHLTNEQQGK